MVQINRKIDYGYILKSEVIGFAKEIHVESKSKIGFKNDFWPEQPKERTGNLLSWS